MPDVSLLQSLCNVLGISLNELFSGEHIYFESHVNQCFCMANIAFGLNEQTVI